MKILITSTSFQSLKGPHLDLLTAIPNVQIENKKGPLPLAETLNFADHYDAIICGDDDYNADFFKKASGKLKVLSKYGVGLDRVDLAAAKNYGIPVKSCPGVNSTTVAEHVFALLLTHAKNIIPINESTRKGDWSRPVGFDLLDKTIGIIGFGNVGKEVAKRANAFGMRVLGFDPYITDEAFNSLGVTHIKGLKELVSKSDVLSLHIPLNKETRSMLKSEHFTRTNDSPIVINTSRGGIIEESELLTLLNSGQIAAYLTDVLEKEPISPNCVLKNHPRVLITSHVGSRTIDNIRKQALMATRNLLKELNLE